MYCRKCGAQNPDDSVFCQKCGERFTTVASDAPPVSTEDTQDRLVASVLSNRFELTGERYRGGMATVYVGVEKSLNRKVAIKVLSPSYQQDAVFIGRFRQEASTAANLEHPYIVRIHHLLEEAGLYAIVMQWLSGGTLKERIGREGPIGVEALRRWGGQVCAGLSHAHGKGVIHCDLKPANVMFDGEDRTVLVDFGISRARMEPGLTQAVGGLMSPPYMSPEQSRGETRLDQRSDIYSVGVVLYEMATGSPPFRGESPLAYAHLHQQVDPEPPVVRAPETPQWLNDLILSCLSKDPEARPGDIGKVEAALRSGECERSR